MPASIKIYEAQHFKYDHNISNPIKVESLNEEDLEWDYIEKGVHVKINGNLYNAKKVIDAINVCLKA